MFMVVFHIPSLEEDKYCLGISRSEKLFGSSGEKRKHSSCHENDSVLASEGEGRRYVTELCV